MGPSDVWPTPWIAHGTRRKKPTSRLFCFSCAGGGASSYRHWNDALPASIEVCPIQLPGRETRADEPLLTDLLEMVEEIGIGLEGLLDLPFALFGHSLGGLLAFEVARDLRKHGHQPNHLFIAGTPAPHLPRRTPPIHQLPEADLIKHIRGLDGTPEAILERDWLLQLHLPILRADMTCLETYIYGRESLLNIPITTFAGIDDPQVRPEQLRSWSKESNLTLAHFELPGGHFFIQDTLTSLTSHIASTMMP